VGKFSGGFARDGCSTFNLARVHLRFGNAHFMEFARKIFCLEARPARLEDSGTTLALTGDNRNR
jgi:hypothetical protein